MIRLFARNNATRSVISQHRSYVPNLTNDRLQPPLWPWGAFKDLSDPQHVIAHLLTPAGEADVSLRAAHLCVQLDATPFRQCSKSSAVSSSVLTGFIELREIVGFTELREIAAVCRLFIEESRDLGTSSIWGSSSNALANGILASSGAEVEPPAVPADDRVG